MGPVGDFLDEDDVPFQRGQFSGSMFHFLVDFTQESNAADVSWS